MFDILTDRTNQLKLLATTFPSYVVLHLIFVFILFFSRLQKLVVAKRV